MRLVMTLLLLLSATALADEPRFTMADLAALEKQESWQELLLHLADVPPSQRDDAWLRMLDRSALAVLSSLSGQDEKAWAFADTVGRQYPQLLKVGSFVDRRAKVATRGLEACLQRIDPKPCADRAVSYLEGDKSAADLAFALARLIARRDPPDAVRAFRLGLQARHEAKDCSDDALRRSVGDAFELRPDDERVADAVTITSELCWEQLKEPIIDRFIGGDRNVRKNTCPFLTRKKDALSPISMKQCESLK